jgi:hypothetical protein
MIIAMGNLLSLEPCRTRIVALRVKTIEFLTEEAVSNQHSAFSPCRFLESLNESNPKAFRAEC